MVAGPSQGHVDQLARLSETVRHIATPGPDFATQARLRRRFEDLIEGRRRRHPVAWLVGWVGFGPRPRGMVQRFAAGGMLLVAAGTGGGAVAGESPLGLVLGAGDLAGNIVQNLAPHDGGGTGGLPTAAPSQLAIDISLPGVDGSTADGLAASTEAPTATPTPLPVAVGGSQPPPQQPGGAQATPTATPTRTPTPRPAPTKTAEKTPALTPTPPPLTPTASATPSPTAAQSPTPSPTPPGDDDNDPDKEEKH